MKREFVTLYGKAIIERDILFLRSPYLPFSKTAFAQIGYELLLLMVFIMALIIPEEGPKKYVRIIFLGLLVVCRIPNMVDKFLKRSYAGRIPLSKIKSFEINEDLHGLQTEVTLFLANGRYKKITFRRLENQYDAFLQLISQYSYKVLPA